MATFTPRQRMITARSGRRPDKLPVFVAAANSFICRYYGLSVTEYLTDARRAAESQIALIKDFNLDGCVIASGYILYGCGPELGVDWRFSGDDWPGFSSGPLKTEADLESLKIPGSPSGYFAHYLEIISRTSAALGQSHALNANILGPFAALCFLRGIEKALLDTALNPGFFSKCLAFCTDLSIYFGRAVLATDVPATTLNEIFLTPQMISPESYHRQIAPADRRVQEALTPNQPPNIMGAFMGQPGDRTSQKGARALYRAFFGIGESVDSIRAAFEHKIPGLPFPLSVSGRMLDAWPVDRIIAYLEEGLDFLVGRCGIFPSLNLISIQAESRDKAAAVAEKLKALVAFRDHYRLGD